MERFFFLPTESSRQSLSNKIFLFHYYSQQKDNTKFQCFILPQNKELTDQKNETSGIHLRKWNTKTSQKENNLFLKKTLLILCAYCERDRGEGSSWLLDVSILTSDQRYQYKPRIKYYFHDIFKTESVNTWMKSRSAFIFMMGLCNSLIPHIN